MENVQPHDTSMPMSYSDKIKCPRKKYHEYQSAAIFVEL